jgi:tripartite-type tricarboxylate transporter receptor subunit TctC
MPNALPYRRIVFSAGVALLFMTGVAAPTYSEPAMLAAQPSAAAAAAIKNGVTIVANLPPGGITDTGARALQPYLQGVLNVPVRIQNIPGGGGNTAAQYVYHLASTQAVLMMAYLPQLAIGEVIGAGDYKMMRYTPLYGVYGGDTSIYIAKAGGRIQRYADMLNSKSPVTVGVFGIKSSAGWLSTEFLTKINHLNIQAVPFDNGTAAADAVLGGAIDVAAIPRSVAAPLIAQGRALAVVQFSPRQLAYLPGVPSIASVGKPSEAFTTELGIVGPPGMPADVASLLAGAIAKAAAIPAFRADAEKVNFTLVPRTTREWTADMARSYAQITAQKSSLLPQTTIDKP